MGKIKNINQIVSSGTFLVVQWLRLHASNAGVLGSVPGQGTRSHMLQLRLSTKKFLFFLKSYQRCNKPGLGLASSRNQKYLKLWSLRGKNQDVLVQLCSVAQSCPSLCNPMDCSTGPSIAVHSSKFVLLILCVSVGLVHIICKRCEGRDYHCLILGTHINS